MKVRLVYCIEFEKEVEMSAEEYCNLHADLTYGGFFPANAFARETQIDFDAARELEDFFHSRK